jgi:hypothetical protein
MTWSEPRNVRVPIKPSEPRNVRVPTFESEPNR